GVLAIFEEQLLTPSLARGLRLRSPRRALPGIVAREMLLAPSTRDDPLATALDAAGLVATFGQGAAFPPGVVVAAVTLPAVGGPRASLLLAWCGAVRHAPSFPQSDCAPGARPRARGGALAFLEVDQAHALRVAADHADLVDAQADHLPTARDQHDLIVIRHHANAHHTPRLVGGLHGDDALAAAPRETVLLHLGALAVAVLGHREEGGAGLHQIQGDHLVSLVELHAPHAVGVAAHRPGLLLLEADRLAVARREDRLARAVGQPDADHLVALLERDGDDARRPRACVLHEVRLLDQAPARREEHVAPFLELAHGEEGRELLLGLQAEHVRNAPPAGRPAGLGDLMHLQPEHFPGGGEEEEVG